MGRLIRSSLIAVCLLFFSPSLRADDVHRFIERADSFSDSSINFADGDRAPVDGDSTFFEFRTLGSNEDHLNWLDDSEDHHGKAWGWHKHHHHHGGGWNFGNQGNQDTDGNSGNAGITSIGDPPTSDVPEPSVLVLLTTA